jgi:hypothetical protein
MPKITSLSYRGVRGRRERRNKRGNEAYVATLKGVEDALLKPLDDLVGFRSIRGQLFELHA